MRVTCIALAAACILQAAAAAAEEPASLVDELRLGIMVHDVGFLGSDVEEGLDVNIEARFASPTFLDVLLSPRPHLGVSANTEGDTSYAYFGLTWHAAGILGQEDSLFIEGSLGGAVHDGAVERAEAEPGEKPLGTRVLFRESVEIGYAFTARQSVSVMFDHLSNANLGDANPGLNNVGIRYGVRF
jgi:hypothetical protein